MYFQDRKDAANRLAATLLKHTDDDVVIASLNPRSEMMGQAIAIVLHASQTTLISRAINLPGNEYRFGTLDQVGNFSYNTGLTKGEIDDYESEYHNYLESEKMTTNHQINMETSKKNLMTREEFNDKIVILVGDGLDDTHELDAAIEYLKPIRLKKLVIAVPVASVAAVDRMHITCDEIHCLSVTENYISNDHYYEDSREK